MVDLSPPVWLFLVLTPVPALHAADLPAIRDRGRLRVLTVLVNQQNDFISAQPGRGFDRELLEGFATLERVNLEMVAQSSWDALVPALLAGKGDLIAGRFTMTEGRRKVIAFTSEVFPTRNVVLTRKPHRVVTTLEEFRAERVGTVKGTSMAEAVAAAGIPGGNVDEAIPTGTLPAPLKAGKAHARGLGLQHPLDRQRPDPELPRGLFPGPP